MAEKISNILFGLIFVSLAIAGFGAFYYAGAVRYGVASPFNYASYNRSIAIFNETAGMLTTLTGGNIEFGSGVGLYLTSAVTVVRNMISGEYLRIGTDLITDMTGISGIAVPSWLTTGAIMLLTLVFILAIASIFMGREI